MDLKQRKRGRPTEQSGANIDEILAIALRAFARYGYEGVSLSTISQQAGVADSLLHYHFKSKENLWKRSVERVAIKLLEGFKNSIGILKDVQGVARLKAMTRNYIYFAAKHQDFHRIVLHEMSCESVRGKWLAEEMLKPIQDLFEEVYIAFQKEGLIKQIPLANLSTIITGAANTFFIYAYQMKLLHGLDCFEEKEIERHADIVNDILFNGLLNIDS